jgi:hypothetical protein
VTIGLVVMAAVATVAGRGSGARTVELGPDDVYRLDSSAGPVEVGVGGRARLHYRGSWLGAAPNVSDEPWPSRLPATDLRLWCGDWLPCRATARIEVPAGAEVEVRSSGGEILVDRFAGAVSAVTTGDHDVILGPIEGSVVARTVGGDVVATGLAASDVEISTVGGEVRLGFGPPPASLSVTAGDGPVTVELPPGRYAVSVEGDTAPTIEVDIDGTAESRIRIDGRGPVWIRQAT